MTRAARASSAARSIPFTSAISTRRDAARAALALDEILFMPSHDPPHRPVDPRATAFHRFALVALAIDGLAGLPRLGHGAAREGTSYTVDTLRALHADGWTPSQIFFILGADAFAEIATWHEFPAVLDAAQLRGDRAPRHDARRRAGAHAGAALASASAATPDVVAGPATGVFLVEARDARRLVHG